ncbi:MAG: GNAT family N-acetyltransferase [candidate division KSB1 bacterium]|nr:GNAT family N-acetyltransferase [candidate division KSB1 bacterium]MDZ7305359.1 GNAT family N-acetyltransferase [candidate division KSB1 bacterium]MDZ7314451.1 GNAT family N-acetyltransferase [candidate division KSB1 bacterium]
MGSDHVIIRPWQLEDLPAVRLITWQTWLATYSGFIPKDDLQAYFDSHYNLAALTELQSSTFVNGWVAEIEGDVVGYLKSQRNEKEKSFQVSSIYVLPAYQGKGIGMMLLREAEACAAAHHFDAIWLGVMVQNVEALAWYKKIGFQFVEEAPFTMGRTTVSHLIGYKRCSL